MRGRLAFGEPRDTTPYFVMLQDALIEEPTVEHIPFSWAAELTKRDDMLHIQWPDTLLAARHWVDEGRQAGRPHPRGRGCPLGADSARALPTWFDGMPRAATVPIDGHLGGRVERRARA